MKTDRQTRNLLRYGNACVLLDPAAAGEAKTERSLESKTSGLAWATENSVFKDRTEIGL